MAEATRKYANLRSELSEALENEYKGKKGFFRNPPKLLQKSDVPARKLQELKLAFSEFYLSLILLQNYQNLNFTGFRKILKKHDKVTSISLYMYVFLKLLILINNIGFSLSAVIECGCRCQMAK